MGSQNIGDLGNLRGKTLRKARHPCGNPPHDETDFYPLLAKVGKDVIEGEGTLGFEASLASMTS
jgi:hypothetical protein